MVADAKFVRLMEEHQALLRQFVLTELELALTFCERALTAHRPPAGSKVSSQEDGFIRNADNATRAYHSALRAMERSEENIENDPNVAERMQELEPLLAKLSREKNLKQDEEQQS
jgi:hypothetical protein